MHVIELDDGGLQVLGHFGEVLVVFFVENVNELFDYEYVEVVNFVFEDVDALVFENGVVRE